MTTDSIAKFIVDCEAEHGPVFTGLVRVVDSMRAATIELLGYERRPHRALLFGLLFKAAIFPLCQTLGQDYERVYTAVTELNAMLDAEKGNVP